MSRCPVPRCPTTIGRGKAFCKPHWFALPKPLRDQIWAAYRARDREESLRLIMEGARLLRDARDRCSSCAAPIRWVKTRQGEWMPLDAEPAVDGAVVLNDRELATVLTPIEAVVLPEGTERYRPHWATCPNPEDHRKRR